MNKLSEVLRISLSNLMPLSNNEKIEILHYIDNQDKEIDRLNNIISNLENYLYNIGMPKEMIEELKEGKW